jgi:hypothetical protein
LGVFLGARPTAGYSVTVGSISTSAGRWTVTFGEQQPPADAMAAQVMTAPFHLVRVSRVTGDVVFTAASSR